MFDAVRPAQFPHVAGSMVLAALVGASIAACDGGADPVVDAGTPDANVAPPACDSELVAAGPFSITRCTDRARLGMRIGPAIALDGIGPAIETRGRLFTPVDWPDVTWRTEADGVSIDYRGLVEAPTVRFDVRMGGPCVEATMTIESEGPAALDDVLPLWQGGDGGVLSLGGLAWTLDYDGRPVAADAGQPHPRPRLVASPGGAFVLAASEPQVPVTTVVTSDVANDWRIRATRPGPHDLSPGVPMTAGWVICPGDTAVEALLRHGDHLAERHSDARGELVVGLSVPTANDSPPTVPDLTRAADWAALRTRVRPTLRVERGWYRVPGAWTDTIWSGAPLDLVGARIEVAWPLLQADPGLEIIQSNPAWRDTSCDCARLDPRVPGVRDHLGRASLELRAQGIEAQPIWVWHLDPGTHRALLAALTPIDGPAPSSLRSDPLRSGPPPGLGLSPLIGMPLDLPTRTRAALLGSSSGMTGLARVDLGSPRLVDVPPATARQEAALAILSGVRLLGDRPEILDADPVAGPLAEIILAAPDVGPARAAVGWFPPGEVPAPAPPAFIAPRALALFNWTEAPIVVDDPARLAPDLGPADDLFDPLGAPLDAVEQIEIPPGDVVMWVTVDDGPAPE